jgi:hypothetical protein
LYRPAVLGALLLSVQPIVLADPPGLRPALASISGAVQTRDNLSVARAALVLESAPGVARSEETDDKGHFTFANLADGSYYLRGSKAECCAEAEFGDLGPLTGGTPILIADGQSVKELRFVLQRFGSVTGHVSRPDASRVTNVAIEVVGKRLSSYGVPTVIRIASSRTDDQGRYRIAGIPPGMYWVRASPTTTGREGLAYTQTYYPSAADETSAVPVEVREASETPDVNVMLAQVTLATVTGTIVPVGGRTSATDIDIRRIGRDGMGTPVAADMALQNDRFTVRDLQPGQYYFRARYLDHESGSSQWGASVLQYVLGAPVQGLLLPLRPGVVISGTVSFLGDATPLPLSDVRVSLLPESSGSGLLANSVAKEDGTFVFRDVVPGTYRFNVRAVRVAKWERLLRTEWAPEAILVNGENVIDSGIVVANDLSSVTVVLTDRFGSIEGRLIGVAMHPECYTVVAYRADDNFARMTTRNAVAVRPAFPNGAFKILGLAEGPYRVLVVEQSQLNSWLTAGFLDSAKGYVGVEVRDRRTAAVNLELQTNARSAHCGGGSSPHN